MDLPEDKNKLKKKARARVYHASRLLKYRRPFGALPEGSNVDLFFECGSECSEVTLCYTYGLYSFSYHEEPMARCGEMYKVSLMVPDESGLLFYWFRFIDEEGEIKYYVAEGDTRYGEGKLYHEPPRVGPEEDKYPYAFQITIYDKNFHTPDRIKGAMIYQIFPDRFARSDRFNFDQMVNSSDRSERVYHRDWYEDVDIYGKPETGYLACDFYGGSLSGIAQKMDYIKSLGITILYLNPIFEARSSHRYDTADYMNVDPILGGNSAFNELVVACKEHGIKLILDGVFSHTGADSRYFNKFDRYDGVGAYKSFNTSEESPYRSWYNFWRDEEGNTNYESWWGFPDLPNVNEDDLSYRKFIFGEDGVVKTWLKRGAGGFRLDVSDELPDSFIRQMRKTIKRSSDDKGILIGEVWEDASCKCSYGSYRDFMFGNTHDSVMGYTFRHIVLDFLCNYIDAAVMDSRLEGFRERYPAEAYYSIMNLVSSHDVPRIMTMLSKPADTDNREEQKKMAVTPAQYSDCTRLSRIAYALQIGYIGACCLYYGDEILMEGYKDPFNRRTYPWGRLTGRQEENLSYIRRLARFRNDNACLKTGFYKTLYAEGDVFCCLRSLENGKDYFGKEAYGSDHIAMLINRGDAPSYLCVDDTGDNTIVTSMKSAFVSLNDSFIIGGARGGRMTVGLPPKSFVFVVY
ncbi:MAG: glycoside hydrolase family 13 protein [Clostridiales bacterium]|nr:glycoside hydrolase family 13 protein [Clostridiales bacterium]